MVTAKKSVSGAVARLLSVLLITVAAGWTIGAAVAGAHSSNRARGHHRSCRKHRRCHRVARRRRHLAVDEHVSGYDARGQAERPRRPRLAGPGPGRPERQSEHQMVWLRPGHARAGRKQGLQLDRGSWTVPTATQHTAGQAENSSDWIGIGGGYIDANCPLADSTVIQTGTEQDVNAHGGASYSAWWEIIPGPSLTITTMAVHPGDKMSASIAQVVPACGRSRSTTRATASRTRRPSRTRPPRRQRSGSRRRRFS
jgi:Peptidase A4 family